MNEHPFILGFTSGTAADLELEYVPWAGFSGSSWRCQPGAAIDERAWLDLGRIRTVAGEEYLWDHGGIVVAVNTGGMWVG